MKLTEVRGIGEKRAKDFAKLNIFTAEQLVRYYPRTYLDLTNRVSVREVAHNDMALIACKLVYVEPLKTRGKLKTVRALLEQGRDNFTAVWFNMPYVAERLKPGEYLFYGRVQNYYDRISLVNPTFERLDSNQKLKGLVPVYPLKSGIAQWVVRDAVARALSVVHPESLIPAPLLTKYKLLPLTDALKTIHLPATQKAMQAAAERLAVEEYFALIAAFRLIKGDRTEARVNRYSVTEREVAAFEKRFPFTFTNGQQAAVRAIYDNVTSPHPMNRLLQGDVGSGKTAVALTGIFMAVKSGYQAVYLSPTEVLAAQNYEVIKRLFPDFRVGYLAGASTAKEKREIKEALAAGEIDILCGTHAVLQGDVLFSRLAFCVCDEQHRFGVAQRNSLTEKGESIDVLVMSATPIPRTLSLVFYGDLDVTTIPDKPAERIPVSTAIIPPRKYDDMFGWIRGEIRRGRQAYFVCPKIEDDEGEATSAEELFEKLRNQLPDIRFGLLHGRMRDREKDATMSAFKRKEIDALVATTVIEVGVDVPDATVMVIYDADRFGLSQLHQLRGRVGRGADKSYCFLLTESSSETALERLNILKSTSDGFALAEKDLELRGSGDFLGTRQSGKFLSEIKNLKYTSNAVFMAKKLVDEAFERNLDAENIRRAAMEKYESLKDVVLN